MAKKDESVAKAAENMRIAEESLKTMAWAYAAMVSLYHQALLESKRVEIKEKGENKEASND